MEKRKEMKLTMLSGLAKEQFEKWYSEHPIRAQLNTNGILANIIAFNELNPMFQWGVLQDWADSLGYDLQTGLPPILEDNEPLEYHAVCNKNGKMWFALDFYKTRQEARNAAIEKLNQLINEK